MAGSSPYPISDRRGGRPILVFYLSLAQLSTYLTRLLMTSLLHASISGLYTTLTAVLRVSSGEVGALLRANS